MLVLGRKSTPGVNSIKAITPHGDEITFVILSIDGGHVRVGIEADKSITIIRSELGERTDGTTRTIGREVAANNTGSAGAEGKKRDHQRT